jgi:hypothetical protein
MKILQVSLKCWQYFNTMEQLIWNVAIQTHALNFLIFLEIKLDVWKT